MAYDVLAESVALIESRQLVRVQRLSRRRRFAAMSVDVDTETGLAVTAFARRGVGCIWRDRHVLALRQGRWVLLGGGGSNGDADDLLADRPPVLAPGPGVTHQLRPGSGAAAHLILSGVGGGVHDSGGRADRWPWSGRWVNYTELQASSLVSSLAVSGRVLPVPWHGLVVIVWTGPHRPRVVAQDRDGRRVEEVVLTAGSNRKPIRYRDGRPLGVGQHER